jgi:hypothetical protein
MAIRIKAPTHSFVQFDETDIIDSCQFDPFGLCLPVFADSDVAFQFILETDTQAEADALCGLSNASVVIGLAEACDEDMILEFADKPERFRIGLTSVLYNWSRGLPNFGSVIDRGQCFFIKITIQGVYSVYDFCSNCFQRISDPCHTSVIDYGNDENAFGFDYCGGAAVDSEQLASCDPLIVQFTNKATLAIPYTTELQLKYGPTPSVMVWLYDENNDLVEAGIRVAFDTYPPTVINADFGCVSSGIIRIS